MKIIVCTVIENEQWYQIWSNDLLLEMPDQHGNFGPGNGQVRTENVCSRIGLIFFCTSLEGHGP